MSSLEPSVSTSSSLLLWQNPVKTAAVFTPSLLFLLALQNSSLLSVTAYSSLLMLAGVLLSQVYWYLMVYVLNKLPNVPESDPLYSVNNLSFELAPETVKWIADTIPLHVNRAGAELKAVILCHSWQKTAYFAIAMYCLSIIGGWFNLLTLVILAWIGVFTFPRVYEQNKELLDANLKTVKDKFQEVHGKVNAYVPKKSPSKEE